MNLDLINERYTDSKYESYFLLKEHWNSYTDSQKRFIKECEDITNSIFPELLQEGPLDKARSRAAGAWTGAKNLKKSLTGRGFTKKQGSEIEDVGQAKLNKRVQLFQSGVGKVLGELQRDLGKMGIQGEDHPTIKAITYLNGSAKLIGTEEYPIEVKAGYGGQMADKALEWTNTKIQKILTDIKAAADKEEQMEFPGVETFKFSDKIKKNAGNSLKAIAAFTKKNPKMTNFAIGALVAASRLSGIPGSGIVAGLILRSAVGVIKGEDIQQAVGNAAKVAVVGTVAGAAIGELGDALSDSPEQVAGALDQAGDAGEAAAEDWTAEMTQQAIEDHKETLMQGRELGIPNDYKLSFNNGQLSVNSQELTDLLNGPKGDEVLGALRANELSRIKVDDWMPAGKQMSDRVLDFRVRMIDMLDNIRNARRG
jgi:hypothetical protein